MQFLNPETDSDEEVRSQFLIHIQEEKNTWIGFLNDDAEDEGEEDAKNERMDPEDLPDDDMESIKNDIIGELILDT